MRQYFYISDIKTKAYYTHPIATGPSTSNMSSRKTAGRRGTTKKRAQRATSNVFAMFNQDQIQEFKEAFNMIDQNRDGFIDKEDLHDMLASLGKDPTDGVGRGRRFGPPNLARRISRCLKIRSPFGVI